MAIGKLGVRGGGLGGLGLVAAGRAGDVPGWASLDFNFATGQYFGGSLYNALTITRSTTGYATNTDGTLTLFQPNTFRIGVGNGLLIEEGAINEALWSRDMTNAVWAKTTMTAAKDQTDINGVANAASSITATGANATILQTVTRASDTVWQSAYIKRLVGSGTINMTTDNGVTWTVVTATAAWTRVTIPVQTLANPICGFRIVTSGDSIAVDFVQNEHAIGGGTADFSSSPIPTTTAAAIRQSDLPLWNTAISNILLRGPGSVVFSTGGTPINTGYGIMFDDVAHGDEVYLYAAGQAGSWNGLVELLATFGTGSVTGPTKLGYALNGAGRSLVVNNGTVATNAGLQSSVGTTASLGIKNNSGSNGYNGYIKRVTIGNTRIADATLKAATV